MKLKWLIIFILLGGLIGFTPQNDDNELILDKPGMPDENFVKIFSSPKDILPQTERESMKLECDTTHIDFHRDNIISRYSESSNPLPFASFRIIFGLKDLKPKSWDARGRCRPR